MTMKNDAKFEKQLTCRFKIGMRNLMNLSRALKNLRNLHFNGLLLKVYNVWAKKGTEELCFMILKSDAKFEGKLPCGLENDIKNLANFHRLKNSDFILESKMAELDQNKNSKQAYFILSSKYMNRTIIKTFLHMFHRIVVLKTIHNY